MDFDTVSDLYYIPTYPGDAPFTCKDLSEAVFGVSDAVLSYEVKESESIRYKQSYCVRIELHLDRMCQNKEICDRVSGKIIEIDDSPYSIFYKRIVPREMPYAMEKWRKSPFKTDRDKKANENEASFLSFLGEIKEDWAIHSDMKFLVGSAYKLQSHQMSSLSIDANFSLLLYDFSPSRGWYQTPFLNEEQLRAGIRFLAFFHAKFWNENSEQEQNLEGCDAKRRKLDSLWKIASYIDMSKQPSDQVQKLPIAWARIMDQLSLEEVLARIRGKTGKQAAIGNDNDPLADCGNRLAAIAGELNQRVHGRPQTYIHGDPKAANFFWNLGKIKTKSKGSWATYSNDKNLLVNCFYITF